MTRRPPILVEALRLAALGVKVCVFTADGKPGARNARLKDEHGNAIPKSGWQRTATADPEIITGWFGEEPDSQLRVPSGLNFAALGYAAVCIDIDRLGATHDVDGFGNLAKLEAAHGPLPDTLTHETPSGGQHRIFAGPLENPLGCGLGGLAAYPGVEVKGKGGLLPWPPSSRGDGAYRVLRAHPLEQLTPLPAAILALIRERPGRGRSTFQASLAGSGNPLDPQVQSYTRAIVASEFAALQQATAGQRNIALNKTAFALGQIAWSLAPEMQTAVYAHAEKLAHAIGLEPYEIGATLDSGWYAGQGAPRPLGHVGYREHAESRRLWEAGIAVLGTPAETFLKELAPTFAAYPDCFRYLPALPAQAEALMVRVASEGAKAIAGVRLLSLSNPAAPPILIGDGARRWRGPAPAPLPVLLRAHESAYAVTPTFPLAIKALAETSIGIVWALSRNDLLYRLPLSAKQVLLVGVEEPVFEAAAHERGITSRRA